MIEERSTWWATWWRRSKLACSVRETLEAYREGREGELSLRTQAVALPLQLIALTVRELIRDNVPTLASSLAYTTMVSIIPLLSVATSLLAAFGVLENFEVVSYLQSLFPEAASDITGYLQDFTDRSARYVGGVGAVVLLVIGIFLFHNIEKAFTRIWRGSLNRPVVLKFLMLYTLISLGPLLLAVSIIESARAQIFVSSLGLDPGPLVRAWPFLLALLVFTLMNKILPNAVVEWRAAFLGALFTATTFELAKWGFNIYVAEVVLESYNRVYGAVGLIPIFMLWVYITWFVILVGAELSYCLQHIKRILRTEVRLASLEHKNYGKGTIDPMVGLEIFVPVASAYAAGRGALSEHDICSLTQYNAPLVREVVTRLVRTRVLMVTGRGRGSARMLAPARPLEDIALATIVDMFCESDHPDLGNPVLAALTARYTASTHGLVETMSARDLFEVAEQASAGQQAPDAAERRAGDDGEIVAALEVG